MAIKELELSPTVDRVQHRLSEHETVFALDIVKAILDLHPSDYAPDFDRNNLKVELNGGNKPIADWLLEVRELFDEKNVPLLDGRIVILGLAILDRELRDELEKTRTTLFFTIEKELNDPLEQLLSKSGLRKYKPESFGVGVVSDDAQHDIAQDRLGRAVYAKFLAKRLIAVSEENRENDKKNIQNQQLAFAVHVFGPWGSGKSTILNFLRQELEKEQWLVVEFNAWKNQKLRPPWWVLMEFVFYKARIGDKNLTIPDKLREYWWRLRLGYTRHSLYLFALAMLLTLGFWVFGETFFNKIGLTDKNEIAAQVGAAASSVVGALAAVYGIIHSVLSSSIQGAEGFLQSSNDPMKTVSKRFEKLIERIEADKNTKTIKPNKAKRVVIFIDDLDRCEPNYVVELLEGFQTLFRKRTVFFIVAADQKWLNACFETVYSNLSSYVKPTGKPLGMLFLEKVFQFSAPMPSIPDSLKKAFWDHHLLNIKGEDKNNRTRESIQEQVIEQIEEVKTDVEIDQMLGRDENGEEIYEQVLREQLILRLATQEYNESIEAHILSKFSSLLEPNPRSMKRLVNAYSVNRALSTLSHLDIDKDKLALWTILEMRWPLLTEHLTTEPENLEVIKNNKELDKQASIRDLLQGVGQDVLDVVNGNREEIDVKLGIEDIKKCGQLKM